jgi:hypothetical protein
MSRLLAFSSTHFATAAALAGMALIGAMIAQWMTR